MDRILIRGARTHNLKNLNLDLPRDKLIVITGLSGSGKSSLAFDTLYAEGQRRYVESLSAYARQFLSLMEKPDVDSIDGLSPAIAIEQKSTSHNPRSTVGTVTEIHDYLRLLYARAGEPRCPEHGVVLKAMSLSQMVDTTLELPEDSRWMILAPIIRGRKGEYLELFEQLKAQGYLRVRIDGQLYELDSLPKLAKTHKHDIEVVIDRFKIRPELQGRLAESFATALRLADGLAILASMDTDGSEQLFSANYSCPHCGHNLPELEPKLFSFNSPAGACGQCDGLGVELFFDPERIVQQPQLSLSAGAIKGWDKKSNYYYQMLQSLARHDQFSVETPFNQLTAVQQQRILYGTGEESLEFVFKSDRGSTMTKQQPFEGVLVNLERRYRDTDSNAVREELSRLQSSRCCPVCQGTRLNLTARHVFIDQYPLPAICSMPVSDAQKLFERLALPGHRGQIAEKIRLELVSRLGFLVDVGLDYLSLDRSAETLSGGEAQRIRLASQIGSALVGVMYILDEPSIGLHQRDNQRLLNTLTHLRDLGNTVIVVEHDEDAIRLADQVLDIGPGAGVHGGQVVAQGTPEQLMQNPESLTGRFLSGHERIEVPQRHLPGEHWLKVHQAQGNNLKQVDLALPLGLFNCITGVSGSGKSTLINDTLLPWCERQLNGSSSYQLAPCAGIDGLDQLDKVVAIDQSPIGRTPRSNPATYTGVFTPIRELFAAVPEARARGYDVGRFSFNVKGGRCEACQGDGLIRVEMHFLPDVFVTCDQCQGLRYNRETLEIQYKGKTISDVLAMTVEQALEFFSAVPSIARKLQTLVDVGLTYIRLGQAATTLSGGEAQRVKLSRELSRRDTGRTLYILDEPTTGLHFQDIRQLLVVLHRLRDHGNTLVVIEHNLDVIKTADWIVDLGPEGGHRGGQIIAEGSPEQVAQNPASHTGHFLKPLLSR